MNSLSLSPYKKQLIQSQYKNYKICNLKDITDYNAIITLLKQITKLAYFNYKKDYYYNLGITTYDELFIEMIKYFINPSNFFIVIYNPINLELIGYCFTDKEDLSIINYYPWLCDLTVNNKYQGYGFSRLILKYFNKEMELYGYNNYYLYCKKNLIKLYYKLGYKFLFS